MAEPYLDVLKATWKVPLTKKYTATVYGERDSLGSRVWVIGDVYKSATLRDDGSFVVSMQHVPDKGIEYFLECEPTNPALYGAMIWALRHLQAFGEE